MIFLDFAYIKSNVKHVIFLEMDKRFNKHIASLGP